MHAHHVQRTAPLHHGAAYRLHRPDGVSQDPQTTAGYRPMRSTSLSEVSLSDQPDLARRLAEAGHALVHRDFTIDVMLERYEVFLRQVVESNRRPPNDRMRCSPVIRICPQLSHRDVASGPTGGSKGGRSMTASTFAEGLFSRARS